MNRRYSKTDFQAGRFYQLGKSLFKGRYKCLSNNERVVYAVLKDRFELSIQSGWVDEDDNIFFYFNQESLSEECCVSLKTIQRCLQNLIQNGLIDTVQQGMNQPNRLYLLKPDCEKIEEKEPTKPVNTRTSQFDLSGQVNLTFPDKSKSPTNDTEENDTERSDTSSSSEQAFEDEEQILEKTKVCEDDLSERLCEKVQTVLIEICRERGSLYRVDKKEVKLSEELREEIVNALNPLFFAELVRAIQNNPEPIKNIKPFVFACVYNFLRGNMRMGANPCIQSKKNEFNDYEQNQYDYEQLEKEIVCN